MKTRDNIYITLCWAYEMILDEDDEEQAKDRDQDKRERKIRWWDEKMNI